jgi:hypothetical protein
VAHGRVEVKGGGEVIKFGGWRVTEFKVIKFQVIRWGWGGFEEGLNPVKGVCFFS